MSNKSLGIKIDDYVISFPEGEFIEETEEGLSVLVDIYRVVGNERTRVAQEEVTEELRVKIEAFINTILTEAVEEAERVVGKDNVKD